MPDDSPTPVVFRVWPGKEGGSVIALFPTEIHNGYTIVSYEHVGQHGAADYFHVVQGTKAATPEEYAPLKKELEEIGYNLKVYTKGAHLLPWRR